MPHPFSKIIPDARIYIDHAVLDSKLEMAKSVAKIFATWASIEREFGSLLTFVLGVGATSRPAFEIYKTLTSERMRINALHVAAKAALPSETYNVFAAVIDLAEGACRPRNELAHWVWGGCEQREDVLALIDPEILWGNDRRATDVHQYLPVDVMDGWSPDWIDPNYAKAYSQGDLDRALRDLTEAHGCLIILADLLLCRLPQAGFRKHYPIADSQSELLDKLNEKRLFREALARRT